MNNFWAPWSISTGARPCLLHIGTGNIHYSKSNVFVCICFPLIGTLTSLLIGTFTLLLMVTPKLHFILPDFDLLVCIWNIEHPPFSFPRLLRWACKGALHSSYFRKKKRAGWSPGARKQPIATLQAAVPIHPLNTCDRFQGKTNHWIHLLNQGYPNIAI